MPYNDYCGCIEWFFEVLLYVEDWNWYRIVLDKRMRNLVGVNYKGLSLIEGCHINHKVEQYQPQ